MTLGVKVESLKRARIINGMSIRALAKTANLSTATVFKTENQATVPSPATAKKICNALGLEFDDLFVLKESKAKVSI